MKALQGVGTARGFLYALLAFCIPFAAHAEWPHLGAPHLGNLRAFATPRYTLIMQDSGSAKLLAEKLASLDSLLATLLQRDLRPTGKPTFIYVMRAETWHPLLDEYDGAAFLPQRFANYILVHDHQRGAPLRAYISGEYTRLFLHDQFRAQYPLWFEEGLARLMTLTSLGSGKAYVANPDRLVWENPTITNGVFSIDTGNPAVIPLGIFMKVNAVAYAKFDYLTSYTYDRQSSSMVYRAFITDPNRRAQMMEYLKAHDALKPLEVAVQEGFGMSVEQLEHSLRDTPAALKDSLKIVFPAATADKLDKPRVVDETEGLATLARALIESPDDGAAVDTLLDQAAALSPGSIEVRTIRLYRCATKHDDAALMRELGALEPAMKDPAVARAVGLALVERIREAEAPTEIRERAFTLLDQWLSTQPDDAEAAWGFGIVAAQLNRQLPLAESRLNRADELIPRSADLAMAKALVYEAMGQAEPMLTSLIGVVKFSRQSSQRLWAATRLDALRSAARADNKQ